MRQVKTILLTVSLLGNLVLGSAAYTYHGQAENYDTIVAENQSLSDEAQILRDNAEVVQAEMDELRLDNATKDTKITDLTVQAQSLTQERDDLKNQISELTTAKNNLQAQVDSLKSSSSKSSSSSSSYSSDDSQSYTVYVTNTGSKYHKNGCQYLRKSKIPISLSSAKAQGYTACSRCF